MTRRLSFLFLSAALALGACSDSPADTPPISDEEPEAPVPTTTVTVNRYLKSNYLQRVLFVHDAQGQLQDKIEIGADHSATIEEMPEDGSLTLAIELETRREIATMMHVGPGDHVNFGAPPEADRFEVKVAYDDVPEGADSIIVRGGCAARSNANPAPLRVKPECASGPLSIVAKDADRVVIAYIYLDEVDFTPDQEIDLTGVEWQTERSQVEFITNNIDWDGHIRVRAFEQQADSIVSYFTDRSDVEQGGTVLSEGRLVGAQGSELRALVSGELHGALDYSSSDASLTLGAMTPESTHQIDMRGLLLPMPLNLELKLSPTSISADIVGEHRCRNGGDAKAAVFSVDVYSQDFDAQWHLVEHGGVTEAVFPHLGEDQLEWWPEDSFEDVGVYYESMADSLLSADEVRAQYDDYSLYDHGGNPASVGCYTEAYQDPYDLSAL